jgi:hypothetical protein
MPGRGVDRRLFKVAVAGLLPAALIAVGLVAVGLAADFPGHVDLSNTPHLSGPPDIKAFGNQVFVAWSDGFNGNSDTKDWGYIYVRGAVEGDKWHGKKSVMSADLNNWGIEPRLILDRSGSKVHVVWAQVGNCNGNLTQCSQSSIRYAACNVAGGTVSNCQSASITSTAFTAASSPPYRTPDIAQDSSGALHVAWSDVASKQLRYSRCASACSSSANWSAPSPVFDSTDGVNPRLAFSSGALHLVWDKDTVGSSQIYYYRDLTLNNGTFDGESGENWSPSGYTNPGNPTIAATGTLVFVGWDMQQTTNTYALAYVISENNGDTFGSPRGIPNNADNVFSTFATDSQQFTGGLKPSLALTGTGSSQWAHLVWHEKVSGADQVFYSHLASVAGAWSYPYDQVTAFSGSVEPDLAVSQAGNVHVAYMEKSSGEWDVFYSGVITQADVGGVFLPLIVRKR